MSINIRDWISNPRKFWEPIIFGSLGLKVPSPDENDPIVSETSPDGPSGSFLKTTNGWDIEFDSQRISVGNHAGGFYVREIIRAEGGASCLVLDQAYRAFMTPCQPSPSNDFQELSAEEDRSHEPIMDDTYLRNIRQELAALEEEEIQVQDKPDELAEIKAARKELLGILNKVMPVNRSGRVITKSLDGARTKAADRIKKAIARFIKSLRQHHPSLARHLDQNIKRGVFCYYHPSPRPNWKY